MLPPGGWFGFWWRFVSRRQHVVYTCRRWRASWKAVFVVWDAFGGGWVAVKQFAPPPACTRRLRWRGVASVRNKTVCGEDLSRAVKYGGSAACRVAVCERAADLSDEILRAIADGKIFAMCRGVKVDADVVEAARVELDRRGAAVGE